MPYIQNGPQIIQIQEGFYDLRRLRQRIAPAEMVKNYFSQNFLEIFAKILSLFFYFF